MPVRVPELPVAVPAVIGIAAILFAQDYYYLKEHQPTHEERRHGVLDILEKDIEWPTLAFFLFLFILVGAAVATGLIESLAHALAWIIDGISKTGGHFAPMEEPEALVEDLRAFFRPLRGTG